MTSLTDHPVTGGVDTHKDLHVAAVIDSVGRVLGTEEFPTTVAGHRQLLRWLARHGKLDVVGVEGTGAWGAGLARFLAAQGVRVVEVDRPNRQMRRRRGKSDTVDAEAAARAALNGEATGQPKTRDGGVEAIRALRVARRSAIKARTQAANQLHALVATAPDELRARLRALSLDALVQTAARFRPGPPTTAVAATKVALSEIAHRWIALSDEIGRLGGHLDVLVVDVAPELAACHGVGTDTAAALLVAAGDNPGRLHSERSFAALCGVSPLDASSGRQQRHRLNRGGDRQANQALWRIALVRMSTDPRTRDYVAKRTAEGRTKKEIMRCLKRYIAREVFRILTDPRDVPAGSALRALRLNAGVTLATVAEAFGTWPSRISELERGLIHDADLATRYELWLRPEQAA
jgi:transposase